MYNSCGGRKTPLMGYNMTPSWCPTTMKRGLHNHMDGIFAAFPPPPAGANKSFTNPNFVNGNNPSLLRSDFYYPPVTKANDHRKSPVEPPQEMKKKRKRKRRNRKRHKKTSGDAVKTDEEGAMPELTKYFKNFNMHTPTEAESALRTRVPSICESEDSFIVFEDGGGEGVESSVESDGVVVEESTDNEGMSSDSYTPRKKVRFAPDKNLCKVHPMIQWSYAYQAARKGPWEVYVRDRDRFHKRIREAEKTLSPILNQQHRKQIFQDRFSQN